VFSFWDWKIVWFIERCYNIVLTSSAVPAWNKQLKRIFHLTYPVFYSSQ